MKITKIALAGVIGLGSIIGTSTLASAHGGDVTTKGNIIFEENTLVTPPVDPENPDKEVEPEVDPDQPDPIEPGTPGPLSIDYASHINFGKVMKSGNAQTYYANPVVIDDNGTKVERAPYVQVTDNRGSKAGWSLSVKQTDQFSQGDSKLEGAVLSLTNGEIASSSSTDGVKNHDIEFANFNETYPVFGAETDYGAGTFTNQFGKVAPMDIKGETDPVNKVESVTLDIPEDLVIEDGLYSTDLEWVLTDTPEN